MATTLRSTGHLGDAGRLRAPGTGRSVAALLASGAILAALIAVGAVMMNADHTAADDLSQQVLVGPRSPTCQRVVVLLDQSGSMSEFARVRTDALATLAAWAPDNLRGDDEVAVVRFALRAATDLPTTSVGALEASDLNPGTSDLGASTEDVLLAVRQVEAMGATTCRTALIFVSDGELTTPVDPILLERLLVEIGVDQVSLVLPTTNSVPAYWTELFPYSQTFTADPNNPAQTATAVGQAIASATGQRLEERR